MQGTLDFIGIILLVMLLFKDMSGKYELSKIREELNRIANYLKILKRNETRS